MGTVLFLIAALLYWKEWDQIGIVLTLTGAAGFFGCGFFMPSALRPVHRAWMTLALILGSIVARFILCIVFFVIVTPIALIARSVGKRFFLSFREKGKPTYWIRRDPEKKINYEQMF